MIKALIILFFFIKINLMYEHYLVKSEVYENRFKKIYLPINSFYILNIPLIYQYTVYVNPLLPPIEIYENDTNSNFNGIDICQRIHELKISSNLSFTCKDLYCSDGEVFNLLKYFSIEDDNLYRFQSNKIIKKI